MNRGQTVYRRKKPKRQEDFDKLEAAEKRRRARASRRHVIHQMQDHCRPPYARPKVKVEKINGIGHKLPVTFHARLRWEIEQGMEREPFNDNYAGARVILEARARTRTAFGYWPWRI